MKKQRCKYCYDKGYYSVYQGGKGGYTDFGPMEYIQTKAPGIEYIPCDRCEKRKERNVARESIIWRVVVIRGCIVAGVIGWNIYKCGFIYCR